MTRVELYFESSGAGKRIGALIYGGQSNKDDYSAEDAKGLARSLKEDGVKIERKQHVGTIPFEYRSTRRPATEVQQKEFWEAWKENNSDFQKREMGCLNLMSCGIASIFYHFKSLFPKDDGSSFGD